MQTSIITFTHIICEEHNTTVKIQKLSDWIKKKAWPDNMLSLRNLH